MVCSLVKEYGCASVPIEAEAGLERVPNDLKSKLQEGENSNGHDFDLFFCLEFTDSGIRSQIVKILPSGHRAQRSNARAYRRTPKVADAVVSICQKNTATPLKTDPY